MRSALLCTIPMLVLAAACADSDPLAPRHAVRSPSAHLTTGAGGVLTAGVSTCGVDATSAAFGGTIAPTGAQSAWFGGGHHLGTVYISAPMPSTFQLPIAIGGSYPRYECLIRGMLPTVGEVTVVLGPDTTSVDDVPRPEGIDDETWNYFGRRMRAWIYEQATDYARRCGCNQTADQVFGAMLSTLQYRYRQAMEGSPLVLVGREFTDKEQTVLRGHVAACVLTQTYRRFWGLDDARDRAWLARGPTADIGDRGLPFEIGAAFGANWGKGIVSGFRAGDTGSCARELSDLWFRQEISPAPYILLKSPEPQPPYWPNGHPIPPGYTPPPADPYNPWNDQ